VFLIGTRPHAASKRTLSALMLSARCAISRDPEQPMCRLVEEQAAGPVPRVFDLTDISSINTRNTSRTVTCYITSVMR
jgi:hypothetical protein